MRAQGATINRWALQYSIFKYQNRQCVPNPGEKYFGVGDLSPPWKLLGRVKEDGAWMFPTSVSPRWPFATPFHSKRGAAELFLRRALRRAPWARNVSSCALWAPVVLGGNTFLELIVNTTCNHDVRFWQKNLKLWCWSCCYGIVTIFHKSSNIQWAETQEQQPTPCVVDFIFCVSVNGIFWSIVLYLWIVYCIFVCIQQACS